MIAEIEKIGEKEIKKILVDIIVSTLDKKEKLIITLVFYEELSIKEIAEILEYSEAEVLDLYVSAMKKIEKLVAFYLNKQKA